MLSKLLKPEIWLVGVIIAVSGYIIKLKTDLAHEREAAREAGLAWLNQRALLADSVVLWEDSTRAVLKENQQLDSVATVARDRATRAAVVVTTLKARIDSINVTSAAPVEQRSDTLKARFAGYEEPVTYDVRVALTPDTGSALMKFMVDPAQLTIEIGCEDLTGTKLKVASTIVVSPDWLHTNQATIQKPDVCNPPPAKASTGSFLKGAVIGAAAAGTVLAVFLLLNP